MRVKLFKVSDSLSPDVATCEHCKQRICWDDISYTHDNGFVECGLRLAGGTSIGGGVTVDPEFDSSGCNGKNAEPTTWYVDVPEQPELMELVDSFCADLKRKLLIKAGEGKDGWDDERWTVDDILPILEEHVKKGDMLDVANFAMFIWHRQRRIIKGPLTPAPAEGS